MGFWGWLFGARNKTRAKINWLDVENQQRQIDSLVNQGNQLAYKQAVIEYDKLVDTILKQLAPGVTFADRLKSLRSKFTDRNSYNQLWRAHIKRNELVHETGSFVADWELTALMRTYREIVPTLKSISLR